MFLFNQIPLSRRLGRSHRLPPDNQGDRINFKLGWSLVIALGLAAAGGSYPHPASAARKAPKRSVKKIATDRYRYQDNFHFGVFLVTSDGIIMTDPINKEAARWLK
tara:strand:- start:535 stop:852 length:318 start_codon:yes stop_codon:yes gene_type:complete